MKYAIVKCINGNYSVHAEGITDLGMPRRSSTACVRRSGTRPMC